MPLDHERWFNLVSLLHLQDALAAHLSPTAHDEMIRRRVTAAMLDVEVAVAWMKDDRERIPAMMAVAEVMLGRIQRGLDDLADTLNRSESDTQRH
jgi:hypothetical protein